MTVFHSAWLPLRSAMALAACAVLLAALPAQAQQQPPAGAGEAVYTAHCAPCHGGEGDGQGYAYDLVYPRPRDFTSGMFKFRTTESGEPPTRADLLRIVANGANPTDQTFVLPQGNTSTGKPFWRQGVPITPTLGAGVQRNPGAMPSTASSRRGWKDPGTSTSCAGS